LDQPGHLETDCQTNVPPTELPTEPGSGEDDEGEIFSALKSGKQQLTAEVGEKIVAELGARNFQEAFCHLKGWYRTASETQAAPCLQIMEQQMNERVELYSKWALHSNKLPANRNPFDIRDNVPMEG